MERPALRRLMADIQMGKIDIVVVYKIDRLSRSLADFARMVDVFDRHKVSFSAVTQQINSATSMGRLMLNVLLSFAQFEREVTGERIRDKIAASKAKGMWMGGPLPLGYDVQNRLLVTSRSKSLMRARSSELMPSRIVDLLRLSRRAAAYWTSVVARVVTWLSWAVKAFSHSGWMGLLSLSSWPRSSTRNLKGGSYKDCCLIFRCRLAVSLMGSFAAQC